MKSFRAYLELVRPHQWVKNIFVLIPLVFARRFFDFDLVLLSLAAFAVFTLASCSTYVLNDLMDYEKDRIHPDKKKRPIPSGRVTTVQAFFLWFALLLLTVVAASFMSPAFLIVIAGYVLMTVAYSLFFKRILFLDVILIALGFVFRVLGGGIAIGVVVSDWMIVLVFLFTLFLAISKRRQEIRNLEKKSKKTREVLTQYTIDLIDQLNAIIVPIVITSYIFYTFSERQNNSFFIATIPLIVYCFFRYLYLLKNTRFGESSDDYLEDWKLLIVGAVWFALAMAGLGVT
ncbi:MAG: decaprenyl-phosphate phosphoribosyltransferase [Candidatus Gracilibacteria bacterium]|nr:decaprenyl-phosphate phosphoribosyltransferase [bacterium]MDZ4216842.1 decaprenyl-phosphate phosphoribosyltransferase [Candidatus Gracilibacteria bacterium]